MKHPSKETMLKYDWFVPFYERALPKAPDRGEDPPEKVPTRVLMKAAAMVAYDTSPAKVPDSFVGGFPKGYDKSAKRLMVIHRIEEWGNSSSAQIEQYMWEAYDVRVGFMDGLPSKGKRIFGKHELEAIRAQAEWDTRHCGGTHEREDFMADQINRLFPRAGIERHKLVAIPLPKPKGKI